MNENLIVLMKEKLLKTYGWEPADGDYLVVKERKKQVKKDKKETGINIYLMRLFGKKMPLYYLKSYFRC